MDQWVLGLMRNCMLKIKLESYEEGYVILVCGFYMCIFSYICL